MVERIDETKEHRPVSYWLPIPLGVLAYGVHRVHMRIRGVRVPSIGDSGSASPTLDAI